jgi:hypothetical protein
MLGPPSGYIFSMFILLVDRPGVLYDSLLVMVNFMAWWKVEEKLHMPSEDLSILHLFPHTDSVVCHTSNNMLPMQPEFELPVVNSDAKCLQGYV